MSTNVSVEKNTNENTGGLLRRFSRKVQSSGVLPRVKSIRYKARNQSRYTTRKKALKTLRRRAEIAKLIKLGKLPDKPARGSYKR
ncbi:MAG: hypothetical protein UX94_C0005G0040 [Parcubacteria group bacterium GW2011_GWA2_47_21]|nr:MAG: hypothetical protein UX94_C0005G0040 [Parcubacteria group bacterium GW2011_GWA2_47_21]